MQTFARVLNATLKTADDISRHYNSIGDPKNPFLSSPKPQLEFPYKRHYTYGGVEKHFIYLKRIHDEKLVFLAKGQEDDRDLCIKFVRTYGTNSHTLLAEHDFAPQLLATEAMPGDWLMVVTEWSKGTSMTMRKSEDNSEVVKKVTEAIRTLHEGGLVHGDVRDVNIIVEEESDYLRVHLLDFDWAGKESEAKYPLFLNNRSIKRHPGAVGNCPILKSHDEYMLKVLRDVYCPGRSMDVD